MTETSAERESLAARDAALRQLFVPGEPVWLLGERYDAIELLWNVELVCREPLGQWALRRYTYDASSGILHFRGERLLHDDEFMRYRSQSRRLN